MPLEFITTPYRAGSSEGDPVHEVDGLRLWVEPVEHGREAIGVRAEAAGRVIAISGDTAPCAGIGRLARGAHLLVHEATFLEDAPGGTAPGHSTARDAGVAAREAGAETLVLTHFLEATIADPARKNCRRSMGWLMDTSSIPSRRCRPAPPGRPGHPIDHALLIHVRPRA